MCYTQSYSVYSITSAQNLPLHEVPMENVIFKSQKAYKWSVWNKEKNS